MCQGGEKKELREAPRQGEAVRSLGEGTFRIPVVRQLPDGWGVRGVE